MSVFTVCVNGKPRDDVSSGLCFYFFLDHVLTCVWAAAAPVNVFFIVSTHDNVHN